MEPLLENSVQEFKQSISSLVVDDDSSLEYANGLVLEGKNRIKQIIAFYADEKEHSHAAWKTICNKESAYRKPVEDAINIIVKKVSEYQTEKRKKAKEEELRIAEVTMNFLEKNEDPPMLVPTLSVEKTTRSEQGTVTMMEDYQVSIIDKNMAVMALVELEKGFPLLQFINIDLVKVKQYCKANKVKEIPGLKIEEVLTPRYRG